ncbi:MAG: efflux RND transporter periplasmic adaptor subunit, partial [Verrucomicrobiota bacterium JB025]|nr:efflux RND transporter periplasmic adaptor subunit [Verrucomicrobiota bacterium JB025]
MQHRTTSFIEHRMPVIMAGLGLLTAPFALAQPIPGAPSAPMEVGVVTMTKQSVPRTISLPGRAVAYQQVSIRPRVNGVIEEILYDPERPLAKGDALFKLDDASYVAAVAAAKAAVTSAEADVPVTQAAYDRAVRLEGSGYTTAQVEQARATLATSKATLESAKAALDYALTQLSWTTITSPIDGMAEAASVSVGDLVTNAQADALTTVTRLDPIEVTMLTSSARILAIRNEIESGTLIKKDSLDAKLKLEDGQIFESTGVLVAKGKTVSTSTGTASIRFRFDNPDRVVLPGMFLRGEIELGTVEAFLVPQRAASRNSAGLLTAFVVGEDDVAAEVEFSDIGTYQNNWVVNEGINEGDRVIVDGLKSMKAGTKVTPLSATINADGLVEKIGTTEDLVGSGPTVEWIPVTRRQRWSALEESCPQGSDARMGRDEARRSGGFLWATFRSS